MNVIGNTKILKKIVQKYDFVNLELMDNVPLSQIN